MWQAQGIVPEAEWEEFIKAMRAPLPATFRITGTRRSSSSLNCLNLDDDDAKCDACGVGSEAFELRDLLKKRYFSKLEGLEIDGVKVSVPTQLPWY